MLVRQCKCNLDQINCGTLRNIIWSISNYYEAPVHTISVYVQPGASSAQEPVMTDLKAVIHRVFSKEPETKVIITGDFKKCDLMEKSLAKYNFKPVLPANTPTHEKLGALDRLWTNLTVLSHQ